MSDRYTTCGNPQRRHDFVLLFEVTDGNPNGDPDADNMPRVDPETMHGLVTDVCLKRKVRNYVTLAADGEPGRRIYVQDQGVALNTLHQEAYAAEGIKSAGSKQPRADVARTRAWMCSQFYDVRMFGAVMTTGVNCGQVRGPVQLTFARSKDPVAPTSFSITRVAITRQEDADVVVAEKEGDQTTGKSTEMGRKSLIPYGLYQAHGFFSPAFGGQTGVSPADLELFWDALQGMWDLDRSASRGMLACRGLYVFSHEKPLGNAPAHQLFDRVQVELNDAGTPPRSFRDYTVTVDEASMPEGVTLTPLIAG
jgi:CRISPR-associated protein Csd2